MVIASARIVSARYRLSLCPSGRATTSVAPAISGQKNSHTDTSNENGVFCSTRSVPSSRYASCIHSSRLRIAACTFGTPLGRPVEPEV